LNAERPDEGSKVGYVRVLNPATVEDAAVSAIDTQVAEVHYEFDRKLATQLAGRTVEDDRKAVLVGAGAIGSHMAECLMREGRFSWTVIDDDYLLPHNLARHIGRSGDVTRNKAQIVVDRLSGTIDSDTPTARPIAANLHSGSPQRDEIDGALADADLIIDATASVLAERSLSDHSAAARRVSIFFNPNGSGAVLLTEPADRSSTLRDLEAQYLGLAGTDERLAGHLAAPNATFAYTGACRAITNLIPESQIMVLSGLVATCLGKAVDAHGGVIRIWSLTEEGAVEALAFNPQPVTRVQAGGWKITLDDGLIRRIMEMREAKLPNETGGILFGVVDVPEKSIHIVSAAPAPPDSKETRTGFTRGTAGVQESIDTVSERMKGQVRYIGEWHSHPPRVAASPSATDVVQIDWLAALFDMDTLPALMLIAGDSGVSVVLANRQAVPVPEADASTAKSA
jgi:integrative and conjugative element protein (TIGR02256 family)